MEGREVRKPNYPYQPLRGLRHLPGIDLHDYDFDPLPELMAEENAHRPLHSEPGQ